ncbi:MAG: carboxypeptidase [Candidatus Latescibacteria bacterium]|nr:carboxypeptidase [Candidatus Latescibacterota bacterium]
MDKPKFDHYYRYDEMTNLLRAFAAEFPQLACLDSIGKSYEGRDIWALTLTQATTGPDLEKPGFYVDGNIHGSEVTASVAALYFAWTLLEGYGRQEAITQLLDGNAVYIIPVVSPDGVEHVLGGKGWVRSGTRLYPHEEERDGLHPQDIDGDGHILSMRLQDPGGGWKVSQKDARLLVPRRFNDTQGPFYRVFPEGLIRNYDGVEIREAPRKQGLDFNRNFPANWQPEAKQQGAGDYPFSEPETRALATFITAHPNICGLHALHTGMESIIHPPLNQTDKEMPAADRSRVREIAQYGAQITGYVTFSGRTMIDDMYVVHGDFDAWIYEQLGLIVFTDELWDVRARSGKDYVELNTMNKEGDLDGLEEVEAAVLKWNDEVLDGGGFIDWQPFQHPQLGPVEIGGWQRLLRNNAPPQLLEETCAKMAQYLLAHAQAAPQLRAQFHQVTQVSKGVFRIAVAARNDGYLPTNVTDQALQMKAADPVEARLHLGEGDQLLMGSQREELGHLSGHGGRRKVEWVVRFAGAPQAEIVVACKRAGSVRLNLTDALDG